MTGKLIFEKVGRDAAENTTIAQVTEPEVRNEQKWAFCEFIVTMPQSVVEVDIKESWVS